MRFHKGNHIESKFKRHSSTGVIATEPVRDALAGRCCLVRWDDGSESLCCTADLRHDHSQDEIPVSELR
jgi:hypothetical protein